MEGLILNEIRPILRPDPFSKSHLPESSSNISDIQKLNTYIGGPK